MGARNTLFIASEVRSGSTYIAEAIAYHFQALCGYSLFDLTKEHFARLNDQSTSDEILGIYDSLYRDQYGWATCKIMCQSLSIILRESRKSEQVNKSFFGADSHWIFVRRRSKVEQAVSLAIARTTGVWHSYSAEDNLAEPVRPGPGDVEDALRAILLSDTYLEALASLIPENRKLVVHYEDFLSSSPEFIARVHGILAPPDVGDQIAYVDATKLRRNATAPRDRAVAEFSLWLTENLHAVENAIGTEAVAARSVTGDQVSFYDKRISALQREVKRLKRRLDGEITGRRRSKAATELQRNSTRKQLKKKV